MAKSILILLLIMNQSYCMHNSKEIISNNDTLCMMLRETQNTTSIICTRLGWLQCCLRRITHELPDKNFKAKIKTERKIIDRMLNEEFPEIKNVLEQIREESNYNRRCSGSEQDQSIS